MKTLCGHRQEGSQPVAGTVPEESEGNSRAWVPYSPPVCDGVLPSPLHWPSYKKCGNFENCFIKPFFVSKITYKYYGTYLIEYSPFPLSPSLFACGMEP